MKGTVCAPQTWSYTSFLQINPVCPFTRFSLLYVYMPVLLSGCGSIISARRQYISIWQNLPVHIMGYSGIMGLFTGRQHA